jgi:hypothetical protein
MTNGIDLIYKLNGNFDEGISVFELSPILLSTGKLINESHKILYPSDREIAINIKPFGKGSFDISILMFAKDIIQQALDFLKSDTGQNVTLLLAYLGYTSQLSGVNLIQLISSLKGKKLKSIDPVKSGEVRYVADDNTSITVAKQVDALYQNCNIHNNIFPAVGRPLEIPGVTSVESFIKNNKEKTKVVYDKDILQSIKQYSTNEIPDIIIDAQEELIENKPITMWVHPVNANLEGGQKSWSFRVGKDETIKAHITDDNFLNDIKNNVIRLANADRLKVEMVKKQVVKGSEIITTNEIIKVEEYVREPIQSILIHD